MPNLLLADYTLGIIDAPVDAYDLKSAVYGWLIRADISVEPREFIYTRCPIEGAVIVRSRLDERIAAISTSIRPMVIPGQGRECDFALRATPMRQCDFGKQAADPEEWIAHHLGERVGVELGPHQHRMSWTWCGKATKPGQTGFYLPDTVYLGRLVVRDADKFAEALTTGIGRHKAFGFGLLQIF